MSITYIFCQNSCTEESSRVDNYSRKNHFANMPDFKPQYKLFPLTEFSITDTAANLFKHTNASLTINKSKTIE